MINQAAPAASQQDPITQRIQAIIDGKEPAPSQLCAYLAETIKDSVAERDEVVKRIQEAEQFLGRFRTRLASFEGVLTKASTDLRKQLAGARPELRAVDAPEPPQTLTIEQAKENP